MKKSNEERRCTLKQEGAFGSIKQFLNDVNDDENAENKFDLG